MPRLARILAATIATTMLLGHCAVAEDKSPATAGIAKPLEITGVHNAFRATDRLISGSQPEGDAAFAALARLGVKTIISVDGGKPDVEAARKHGLRYIHVPIGYDGIPTARLAELVKAASGMAEPIFVHCHHGKHRGPAAVGVIAEAVAGWSPKQAEEWLRQAGTAADYPGLYRSVREFQMPKPEALAAIGPLPESAKTADLVDAMVEIDERFEALKAIQKAGWKATTAHPDIAPAHQAALLWESYRELARMEDTAKRPEDYRSKVADSERAAAALRDALKLPAPDPAALDALMKQNTQSCATCHKAYRNEKK